MQTSIVSRTTKVRTNALGLMGGYCGAWPRARGAGVAGGIGSSDHRDRLNLARGRADDGNAGR